MKSRCVYIPDQYFIVQPVQGSVMNYSLVNMGQGFVLGWAQRCWHGLHHKQGEAPANKSHWHANKSLERSRL